MHRGTQSTAIPLPEMRGLIAGGMATPLLNASAPPVKFSGRWWAIPEASERLDYVLVDEETAREFDELAHRLFLAAAR